MNSANKSKSLTRINYVDHTLEKDRHDRSFARWFQEQSISEMRNVVRQRLQLSNDTKIHLAHLCFNRSMTLSDEDDFDMFQHFALSAEFVDVAFALSSETTQDLRHPSEGQERQVSFTSAKRVQQQPSEAVLEPKRRKLNNYAPLDIEHAAEVAHEALLSSHPAPKAPKPKSTAVPTIDSISFQGATEPIQSRRTSKRKRADSLAPPTPIPAASTTKRKGRAASVPPPSTEAPSNLLGVFKKKKPITQKDNQAGDKAKKRSPPTVDVEGPGVAEANSGMAIDSVQNGEAPSPEPELPFTDPPSSLLKKRKKVKRKAPSTGKTAADDGVTANIKDAVITNSNKGVAQGLAHALNQATDSEAPSLEQGASLPSRQRRKTVAKGKDDALALPSNGVPAAEAPETAGSTSAVAKKKPKKDKPAKPKKANEERLAEAMAYLAAQASSTAATNSAPAGEAGATTSADTNAGNDAVFAQKRKAKEKKVEKAKGIEKKVNGVLPAASLPPPSEEEEESDEVAPVAGPSARTRSKRLSMPVNGEKESAEDGDLTEAQANGKGKEKGNAKGKEGHEDTRMKEASQRVRQNGTAKRLATKAAKTSMTWSISDSDPESSSGDDKSLSKAALERKPNGVAPVRLATTQAEARNSEQKQVPVAQSGSDSDSDSSSTDDRPTSIAALGRKTNGATSSRPVVPQVEEEEDEHLTAFIRGPKKSRINLEKIFAMAERVDDELDDASALEEDEDNVGKVRSNKKQMESSSESEVDAGEDESRDTSNSYRAPSVATSTPQPGLEDGGPSNPSAPQLKATTSPLLAPDSSDEIEDHNSPPPAVPMDVDAIEPSDDMFVDNARPQTPPPSHNLIRRMKGKSPRATSSRAGPTQTRVSVVVPVVPDLRSSHSPVMVRRKLSRISQEGSQMSQQKISAARSQGKEGLPSQWETLTNSPSILDEPASMMMDELESSPREGNAMRLTQEELDDPTILQQTPLFLAARSQLPFPYTQPPDVERTPSLPPPPTQMPQGEVEESHDEEADSSDEREVAKTVKASATPQRLRQSSQYRRLTDIAKHPGVFSSGRPQRRKPGPKPSASQQQNVAKMYGSLAKNDESSDSNSDAGKEVASHIPKSRTAGRK